MVSALDPSPANSAPPDSRASSPSAPAAAASGSATGGGQLARLIRNPKQEQGLPPYALADQQGTVQRYVEPVDEIDLERFVGQVVVVRHDTGRTILASQLALPGGAPAAPANRSMAAAGPGESRSHPSAQPGRYVAHADYQEPTPDVAPPENPSGNEPLPSPRAQAEEIPSPGADPMYLNGPRDTYSEPFPEPYYEPCPNCSSHTCDGGPYCAHQPPYNRYRDRGLLGNLLNDCRRPTGCGPGARGAFYARGEYLWWWFDGMHTPPLVVSGEVIEGGVPNYAEDDSLLVDQILFGGNEILDDARHGGRITAGWFLDPCGFRAIEGDYLTFGSTSSRFFAEGDPILPNSQGLVDPGQTGIGRPFIRIPQGTFDHDNDPMTPEIPESVNAFEDVVFTNIGGSVTVDVVSDFESAGLRMKHNICCVSASKPGCADCCDVACGSCSGSDPCQRGGYGTRRIDLSWGVRYANLEERLMVVEDLEDVGGNQFQVTDVFGTDNDFYGGELGFVWEWEYRRWKVDLLSRLAIGNVRQRVVVDGSTTITPPGGEPANLEGGLLALGSNIGSRERDKLAVLPEVGITLGYQLTCNLSLTAGYSFMYWSSVVRPGDQIDLFVDPSSIPIDTGTETSGEYPRPLFNQTDFFAHGLNFGLEYRR